MNVSAIIVTRGDVDLRPVIESLPDGWEIVVWDNGVPAVKVPGICEFTLPSIMDLSVYGRYAAIEHASHDLIYVQDDDCIVSDPEAIVLAWYEAVEHPDNFNGEQIAVCNMPANFRHAFYQEHGLVGFGACFHRDAPERAFRRMGVWNGGQIVPDADFFRRTCDIVFTGLTPRVLVDVPYEDLAWASAENRMWKQPTHREERQEMLELVLKVRDA